MTQAWAGDQEAVWEPIWTESPGLKAAATSCRARLSGSKGRPEVRFESSGVVLVSVDDVLGMECY